MALAALYTKVSVLFVLFDHYVIFVFCLLVSSRLAVTHDLMSLRQTGGKSGTALPDVRKITGSNMMEILFKYVHKTLSHKTETRPRRSTFKTETRRDRDVPFFQTLKTETRPRRPIFPNSQDRDETETFHFSNSRDPGEMFHFRD